jgi:hypothetical protein
MKPEDEQYDAKMTVLKENIEHLVKEEEGELFPNTKKRATGGRDGGAEESVEGGSLGPERRGRIRIPEKWKSVRNRSRKRVMRRGARSLAC